MLPSAAEGKVMGKHDVVQELAATCGTSGIGKGGSSNGPPTAYLASLLASVPERAASTQLPAIRPPAYIPQVSHILRLSCPMHLRSEYMQYLTSQHASEASY